jgi:16S rRNA processing protein RimM
VSDFFLVAEIKSAYKKNGFVSLFTHINYPEILFDLDKVFIEVFGDYKEFFIQKAEKIKNNYFLKLKNFDTDDDVQFLIGKKIFVKAAEKDKPDKDVYFVRDLIGSIVYRNDEKFGEVTDVLFLPANDVYVIQDINNKEVLIPAVKDYIESFNPEKKILILKAGGSIYDDED